MVNVLSNALSDISFQNSSIHNPKLACLVEYTIFIEIHTDQETVSQKVVSVTSDRNYVIQNLLLVVSFTTFCETLASFTTACSKLFQSCPVL